MRSAFVSRKGRKTWIVSPAAMPPGPSAAEVLCSPTVDAEEAKEPSEIPERLFCAEALTSPPEDIADPYSLQWFLAIEYQRHVRQARWIPELLEFGKHAGEMLLGLGNGLGTDWVQYARHGAKVIACNPVAAELALARRNFELRGLSGRYLHVEPPSLPLPDASLDVACITGLLHEVPEPTAVVEEVFRALKPGGKVLAVVPAKYSVDYWNTLGRIANPSYSVGFSALGLKKLFRAFTRHRVHKRQLRRRDVAWCLRWLPRPWLERLLGRLLILKAFKPLNVCRLTSVAA